MFEFIYTFNLSCAVWCVVSPAAPTSTPCQSSIEQLRVKTLCGVLIVRARLLAGPRWAQEVWDLGLINCLARSSSVFTAHMDHTSHFYQGLGLMMSLWAVGFYVRKPYHRLEVDVSFHTCSNSYSSILGSFLFLSLHCKSMMFSKVISRDYTSIQISCVQCRV